MLNAALPINKRQGQMLTDFSIESIIGNLSNIPNHDNNTTPLKHETAQAAASSHQQQQPIQQDTNKKYRPKNFHCPCCKMAFSNNGQLRNHLRIHTGERPFRCNQPDCHKTFTRNEELTRHKLIHSGVRPHTCNSCGKRFGRKDHLKKHARTHERKRFKKRLFVCRQSAPLVAAIPTTTVATTIPPNLHKDINTSFSSSKLSLQIKQEANFTATNLLEQIQTPSITASSIPTTLPPTKSLISSIPAPSIFQVPNFITTAASDALQEFARDYWSRWYNLMGMQCTSNHQEKHLSPNREMSLFNLTRKL